jgi:hypothetical protein
MSIHHFQARGDHHRPRSSWHHLLDVANDEGEVLARLREFFSSFTPYEIESMPPELRPGKLMGPHDVTDYAFELVTYQLDHGDCQDVVAAFSDVLGHATSRLSLLSGRPPGSEQETA